MESTICGSLGCVFFHDLLYVRMLSLCPLQSNNWFPILSSVENVVCETTCSFYLVSCAKRVSLSGQSIYPMTS